MSLAAGPDEVAGPSYFHDQDGDFAMNDAVRDPAAEEPENAEEEGEGDEVRGGAASGDSSEEEEEDEEAVKAVTEGFIVDDDEEDLDEEEDEERRRHRKKRRKHKHRSREEDEEEDLDEEDLELLEENLGGRIRSRHLTRLRRGRDSESPAEASTSQRKPAVESSDDDLDESNIIGARVIQDIQNIWDDTGIREDDEDGDMDDFIDDDDDEEEGAGAMAEEEREARRLERRKLEKERRKLMRARPELTGIDSTAWEEIHSVFGDGHDYDWALVDEEDEAMADDVLKPDTKYQDVFEPSEIKARLLTEDDDVIRQVDIPERMQLATSTLSSNATLSLMDPLSKDECVEAAAWVTPRLGASKERDFFKPDGRYHDLLRELVEAVAVVLQYIFIQYLEVPYIYTHRRDYISYFNPRDSRARVELLSQEDLWHIYSLGQKYRSLLQRQKSLQATYEKLGVDDVYYEQQLKSRLDNVEAIADVTQWLSSKYKQQRQDAEELRFHDAEQHVETKKHKLPSRLSAYGLAKKTIVSKLAEGFGISAQQIAENFLAKGHNVHFVEDQDLPPSAYAEQFADPDPAKALPSEELLRQARMILSTELGADPILRREIRQLFKDHAVVSVLPTDRGKNKIDEYHAYHNFKYLNSKPIPDLLRSTQFLNILAAEAEHLVTVSITIPGDKKQDFQQRLTNAFTSDSFSDTAKAWNDERSSAIEEAVEKLFPIGVKWTREYVREEAEDFLAKTCGDTFYERLNVAPYVPPGLQEGEPASVLAVSWGKGDPKTDEISCVFLDEAGRFREVSQIENLTDTAQREEFLELVKRRKPDVIVVQGLSIATTRLMQQLKEVVNPSNPEEPQESTWGDEPRSEPRNEAALNIPVVYVHDDVARIYQHSKRAQEEFSSLSLTAKYCVGLARYAQHPLNEFAALGSDLTALMLDEEAQPLVPREKLLIALERALVDVVNKVGVDINRAVNEPYYANLLPYVAGLGPRKAQNLIKKIASLGGNLINREQFIKAGILTTSIFLNAAGFLRIAQDPDYKEPRGRGGNVDYSDSPDPLDDTRIHPEDYELARKMATDALELDEEDVHDEHPSHVVSVLMKDEDNAKKLDELNLDDFAINMYETNQDLKRHTLNVIRAELVHPFRDYRPKFIVPSAWEILTMLTGETQRTLRVGLIVSVFVVRITKNFIVVKLDSGVEGVINAQYLSDQAVNPDDVVQKGQTIPGVIIDVKMDLLKDHFSVELSARPSDVQTGDVQFRRVKPDENWNGAEANRDSDLLQRKKRAEVDRSRRVIKHPNFQNMNSSQAEAYLDKQQPGEVVIRPSSKGLNHLAVTWKVADKLYQHIDVVERNADPTAQGIGGILSIDDKYEYSDLDELIVSHVHAMARRVEDLMNHEKYRKDEDELNKFLMEFVRANPSKSIYGFTLNRKRPGHFSLSFLAKKGSSIQTWPVRVAPEAYYLFDAAAPGVPELCDAFKVRHLHESQNIAGAAGGKTPYGAGRMTPARTPGYATPGRMSIRHAPRTPNPYPLPPQPAPPPAAIPYGGPVNYGTPPPGAYPPPPNAYGYGQPPGPPAPPTFGQQSQIPQGMHPGRAALIQNTGGTGAWAPGGGGRW